MPLSPHCRGEVKNINREKQRKNIKKYICLFLFIDILLLISSMLADNIGDLVPPVAVFWYR